MLEEKKKKRKVVKKVKKTSKFLTTVALSAVIPIAIQCPISATNEKTQIEQGGKAPELRILENQSNHYRGWK